MFKLLFGLPLACAALVIGATLLPLGIAALVLFCVFGALAFALRLTGAILLGVGGLIAGVFGFALVIACCAVALALFGALAHLLVPLLLVLGFIAVLRLLTRPAPPRALGHS